MLAGLGRNCKSHGAIRTAAMGVSVLLVSPGVQEQNQYSSWV